jgi:hypothetical protein
MTEIVREGRSPNVKRRGNRSGRGKGTEGSEHAATDVIADYQRRVPKVLDLPSAIGPLRPRRRVERPSTETKWMNGHVREGIGPTLERLFDVEISGSIVTKNTAFIQPGQFTAHTLHHAPHARH